MVFRDRDERTNRWGGFLTIFLLAGLLPCWGVARASSTEAVLMDAAALTQMEQQAANAQPREQCFLYTQVLQDWTEVEGRQLADGQDEQALATLQHMELLAAKLHSALMKDAKRLKDAELVMSRTTRRLSDMVHVASGDSREKLQATLKHMNDVHAELLTQVFAK